MNPQPVQMLAALTREHSHEIRRALIRLKIPIDQNDIIDIDLVDVQKMKKEIKEILHEDAITVRRGINDPSVKL